MTQSDFHHAVPVYEYLDGWSEDISEARVFDDLPANCQAYVHRLEELIGCRISGASGWAPAASSPSPSTSWSSHERADDPARASQGRGPGR